jgi:hypothetical protein
VTIKQNSFEGGTAGTTVSTGNSGGASGTAFDVVTIGSGATLTYTTTEVMHATKALALGSVATNTTFVTYNGFATTQMAVRFYIRFDTLPGTNGPIRLCDIRTSSTSVTRVVMDTSNRLIFQTSNGTTTLKTFTTALSANTWYRIEAVSSNGTSGATCNMSYYVGDSGSATDSFTTSSANTGVTTNITTVQFGQNAGGGGAFTLYIDDIAAQDGTLTFIGAASSPPIALFTTSQAGLAVTVDGSTSSATSPATVSSYDWDWGDSTTHGTGATPAAHTYSAAGTYTITLTVTDSGSLTGTTNHSVTVAAPAGTVTVQTVDVSTSWTPSSGTVLSVITDGDPTTFDTSSAPPTAQEFDFTLAAMTPPATGQPLKVFLSMDFLTGTSATLAAQLYDGATQRSSLTGVTIPSGSGGTVSGLVTLTFPWTDVSAMSTGGWNAPKVKLQITAS